MFEAISDDYYNVSLQGECYVGEITQAVEFTRYVKVGALAIEAPSVGAFIRHLQQYCPTPKGRGSSSHTGRIGFQHFSTYEETLDVFLNRPETLRNFKPLDERLSTPSESGQDVFYDVTGDFIDIERAIEGVPESFGNFAMGNPRNVRATIMVNVSVSAFVRPEILEARNQRLLQLVDWLENQNVRVHIKLFNANDCLYTEIVVKEFDQYMDLDNLAIAGNTDFFRRLLFRAKEYSKTYRSDYGTATTINGGTMKMPEQLRLNDFGFFLFTENHSSVEKVHICFDAATQELKNLIEEGRMTATIAF